MNSKSFRGAVLSVMAASLVACGPAEPGVEEPVTQEELQQTRQGVTVTAVVSAVNHCVGTNNGVYYVGWIPANTPVTLSAGRLDTWRHGPTSDTVSNANGMSYTYSAWGKTFPIGSLIASLHNCDRYFIGVGPTTISCPWGSYLHLQQWDSVCTDNGGDIAVTITY